MARLRVAPLCLFALASSCLAQDESPCATTEGPCATGTTTAPGATGTTTSTTTEKPITTGSRFSFTPQCPCWGWQPGCAWDNLKYMAPHTATAPVPVNTNAAIGFPGLFCNGLRSTDFDFGGSKGGVWRAKPRTGRIELHVGDDACARTLTGVAITDGDQTTTGNATEAMMFRMEFEGCGAPSAFVIPIVDTKHIPTTTGTTTGTTTPTPDSTAAPEETTAAPAGSTAVPEQEAAVAAMVSAAGPGRLPALAKDLVDAQNSETIAAPAGNTTVPEQTTAAPEGTTGAAPEKRETTAARARSTAVREQTTTAPKETTGAAPEQRETTAARAKSTAVREQTTTAPKETTASDSVTARRLEMESSSGLAEGDRDPELSFIDKYSDDDDDETSPAAGDNLLAWVCAIDASPAACGPYLKGQGALTRDSFLKVGDGQCLGTGVMSVKGTDGDLESCEQQCYERIMYANQTMVQSQCTGFSYKAVDQGCQLFSGFPITKSQTSFPNGYECYAVNPKGTQEVVLNIDSIFSSSFGQLTARRMMVSPAIPDCFHHFTWYTVDATVPQRTFVMPSAEFAALQTIHSATSAQTSMYATMTSICQCPTRGDVIIERVCVRDSAGKFSDSQCEETCPLDDIQFVREQQGVCVNAAGDPVTGVCAINIFFIKWLCDPELHYCLYDEPQLWPWLLLPLLAFALGFALIWFCCGFSVYEEIEEMELEMQDGHPNFKLQYDPLETGIQFTPSPANEGLFKIVPLPGAHRQTGVSSFWGTHNRTVAPGTRPSGGGNAVGHTGGWGSGWGRRSDTGGQGSGWGSGWGRSSGAGGWGSGWGRSSGAGGWGSGWGRRSGS